MLVLCPFLPLAIVAFPSPNMAHPVPGPDTFLLWAMTGLYPCQEGLEWAVVSMPSGAEAGSLQSCSTGCKSDTDLL